MKTKNKYGFVSGGYIFDKMDRIVQDLVETNNPDLKYWMTKSAKVRYLKQVCSEENVGYQVRIRFRFRNIVFVKSYIYKDWNPDIHLAEASFVFVGKNKIHCGGSK